MFKKRKKEKKDKEEKKSKKKTLGRRTKNTIIVIILLALSFLSIAAFWNKAGVAGEYFIKGTRWFLGGGAYLIPLIFIVTALSILSRLKKPLWATSIGAILLLLSLVSFLGIINTDNGGVLGKIIGQLMLRYFDFTGAFIVLSAFCLISCILVFNLSFGFLFKKEKEKEEKLEDKQNILQESNQPTLGFNKTKPSFLRRISSGETKILRHPIFSLKHIGGESRTKNEPEKTLQQSKEEGYDFPPIDLLSYELLDKESVDKSEIKANNEIIKNTLENFNISVTMGDVSVGPTVTQYTLKPSQGIKLSQIVALHNDLSLALAAHPLRIEAPIPGKSWAGIEVPNKNPHLVRLRNLLEDPQYSKRKNYLTIPLGKNVSGDAVYDNLARMPHLLIAGATGTGKSVAIHNILISFLYQNSPRTLKLILIDPKRVELTAYNGVPHLLTPVIVDAQRAINSLKWAISEMERRYELLSKIGARDILSYNEKISKLTKQQKENDADNHKILPFIVIVIDELADIMMSYGRETEAAIVRLAQMARAVGIHLILSTQRPSVEVITGLIKANITFRIAFQVASQIDSRTIIDMAGAEKLLGKGDMLYQTGDSSKPKRIQGAFILEREIKKVVDFFKKQDYEEESQINLGIGEDNERVSIDSFKDYEFEDELYADAKKLILESKKASASLLQRRMRIGYARAARILDMLERDSIIGPPRGSKSREILIKKEDNAF
ncbi:DNA translocase FtsK [bacterium]|nr:MAG: DNA translocase FtsK [bacterium]